MEIFINGQVLKETSLSLSANFSQLISEINRLLGSREEIITDVRVDGEDIPSWDNVNPDMSRIQKLEISSLPLRDYAIASIGDIGDYTGEMLAVLRNVHAISRKDGFDSVRRNILDGLDYILTVIETSGRVLDLKLDQARYDIRSGTQMIQEVQRLKTRIVDGKDQESLKGDFEELELTLTDWLKFLESLLHRYAAQQNEIGSTDEIRAQTRTHLDALGLLEQDVHSIINDLYAGKIAKSLDQFQSRIQVLQEAMGFLQQLRGLGRIRYEALTVNEETLADKIPPFSDVLKELSESIRSGDTVLMRDLLEYEVQPFIRFLREIYGQMAEPGAAASSG